MVTEVSHQSMRYSSVLICCLVISWFVQYFFPQKSLATSVHEVLSGWEVILVRRLLPSSELMTQLPPLSALGTILPSKHNRVSNWRTNLYCLSKVRIKSSAVSCRSINTFWQLDFCFLVCLPSQKLWHLLFLMAISPTPFGLPETHPLCKEHVYLL